MLTKQELLALIDSRFEDKFSTITTQELKLFESFYPGYNRKLEMFWQHAKDVWKIHIVEWNKFKADLRRFDGGKALDDSRERKAGNET